MYSPFPGKDKSHFSPSSKTLSLFLFGIGAQKAKIFGIKFRKRHIVPMSVQTDLF